MNAERQRQIEHIYHAAVGMPTGEREAFCKRSCNGDEYLWHEVQSLLAFENSSDPSLRDSHQPAARRVAGLKEQASFAGRDIGHYKIERLLGRGGMGDVYLAKDTKLNRKIALKLLPADLTDHLNCLKRFEQEAQAASALNHPSILTIHEFGIEDSLHFIAMEYVDGCTLSERLTTGQMSVIEILNVAMQVASALSAAHAAGIIHRDIKPENIMIRPDGLIKILDFGIAKLTERPRDPEDYTVPAFETQETESGMIVGTANYMSPEQALGLEIDTRSDIFSLGVVLYEMLSGNKPFAEDSVMDTIRSILRNEPISLDEIVPKIPSRLAQIVHKTLNKDRAERYKTANDLLQDLQGVWEKLGFQNELFISPFRARAQEHADDLAFRDRAESNTLIFGELPNVSVGRDDNLLAVTSADYMAGRIKKHPFVFLGSIALLIAAMATAGYFASSHTAPINSIAVLPFVNESGNTGVEYLTDGMTETLINGLSKLPELSVKGRSSVFRYKGKETDARQVGTDLNVHTVLNGRLAIRGDNLDLSLELVDARTGDQIWGKQYERKQTDLVALQSEIARDVSQNLRSRISGEDLHRVTKSYTANREAYQLYLQGLYHWHKRTPDDIRRSITLFQEATEKDALYAQAYAGLGLAYGVLPSNSIMTKKETDENRIKRRAALSKAQELDDSLAEVHADLGGYKSEIEWDFDGAEYEFKRAIELNPNFASARQWYSEFLSRLGRHDEAIAEINKAQEIDPFSRAVNANIGLRLYQARRFDESIAHYKKVIEMEPSYPAVHALLANAYESRGMYREAIAERQIAANLWDKDSVKSAELKAATLREALRSAGAEGYWRKHLELTLKTHEAGYESAIGVAKIYAHLGEKDFAFDWLERSFAAHEAGFVVIKAEPAFDTLSSDSRFQDLLHRIGLPQ